MLPSQPASCKLSSDLVKALRSIRPAQMFRDGAMLFEQGGAAKGVYLVERGEVRVLLTAGQSQRQLLDIAGPGAVLGLSESVSGEQYRITAEAGDDTMAVFIPRHELVALLRRHGRYCMEIARLLSEDLHGLYHKYRDITAHPGRPRKRSLEEN